MTAQQSGLREFEKVSSKGWDAGVTLDELLTRVNKLIAEYRDKQRDDPDTY